MGQSISRVRSTKQNYVKTDWDYLIKSRIVDIHTHPEKKMFHIRLNNRTILQDESPARILYKTSRVLRNSDYSDMKIARENATHILAFFAAFLPPKTFTPVEGMDDYTWTTDKINLCNYEKKLTINKEKKTEEKNG